MSFWAYMLHCRGGAFYVGHTDELERRIAQHKAGAIPGFTADHLPVEHVWSQEFDTRDEAKAAEKQIKGWSRAKKLALIRGDWERISALAKEKSSPLRLAACSSRSGQAPTSSGQTERGEAIPPPAYPELVEGLSFSLLPHPETPPVSVASVIAKMKLRDGLLWLNYEVGPAACLDHSKPMDRQRADGLWQSTCFELFARKQGSAAYREFNFSPSSRWAAYRFNDYRDGMRNLAVQEIPQISALDIGDMFELTVALSPRAIADCDALGLSAVIEEVDGTKSYWALAHPPGKPDFHHPACFALTLPAPAQ
ncbi:MAG: GIY-YIG nuclease family protein [Novosphingobium sp.]